jgi:hypothetical protein
MSLHTLEAAVIIRLAARCLVIVTVLSILANSPHGAAQSQVSSPVTTATSAVDDTSSLSDDELEARIQQKLPAISDKPQNQPWNSQLVVYLTTSVLAFGIAVIIIMAVLVVRKSQTGDVLRLFTVPMVIVAAVFLVVTGFSNEQITPVIGLLGTLAGYVLGVQSQKSATRGSPESDGGGTQPPSNGKPNP